MRTAILVLGSIALLSCGLFPPAAPQNVVASISGTTVTVTWSAVPGAETYDVCDRMEGQVMTGGNCSELGAGEDLYATSFTYDVSSVKGVTYSYRVRASNAIGDSAWSEYSNPVSY